MASHEVLFGSLAGRALQLSHGVLFGALAGETISRTRRGEVGHPRRWSTSVLSQVEQFGAIVGGTIWRPRMSNNFAPSHKP